MGQLMTSLEFDFIRNDEKDGKSLVLNVKSRSTSMIVANSRSQTQPFFVAWMQILYYIQHFIS